MFARGSMFTRFLAALLLLALLLAGGAALYRFGFTQGYQQAAIVSGAETPQVGPGAGAPYYPYHPGYFGPRWGFFPFFFPFGFLVFGLLFFLALRWLFWPRRWGPYGGPYYGHRHGGPWHGGPWHGGPWQGGPWQGGPQPDEQPSSPSGGSPNEPGNPSAG